jgi:hypothetical protein
MGFLKVFKGSQVSECVLSKMSHLNVPNLEITREHSSARRVITVSRHPNSGILSVGGGTILSTVQKANYNQ